MFTSERQKQILELARLKRSVSVDDLSTRFEVTPQTIRADLRELANLGKLTRSHGGAYIEDGKTNVEYESRRQIAASEKMAIGIAAAKLIPNNSSLFINIGTTTEAFSDALMDHRGLMVITNNINVASKLRLSRSNEVIIAGGVVRASDGGVVGEAAVDFIKQFKVDYAIIGSSAIDSDGGLLDFDFREVKVAQAIMENARNVILIADSTKLHRVASVRIGHISQVDTLVTDRIEDQNFRFVCSQAGVQVIETHLPEV